MIAQTEAEKKWLAERKKGIGGSDVAAVLGEKYGCPRALYYDKTGVEPDYQHSEASLDLFSRGHALEPLIADRFTKETGMVVRRMPARVSKDRPWMRVNVDRIILSVDESGPGYLECKSANREVFAEMLSHGMPEHYVLQSQHGLAVTGWQWGAFAVLEPYTFQFLWFRFERNEKLIAVLNEHEEAFWNRVKSGNIPDKLADFSDSRCEKCVYRRGCRNAEALPKVAKRKRVYEPDDSEQFAILVGNVKRLSASIEDLDAQLKQEREKVKVWMGEREAVLCPTEGKKALKFLRDGALRWDSAALDSDHPELAAKYKRRGEPYVDLRFYDVNEKGE